MHKYTHRIRSHISAFCHSYGRYAVLGVLLALAMTLSENRDNAAKKAHFMELSAYRMLTVVSEIQESRLTYTPAPVVSKPIMKPATVMMEASESRSFVSSASSESSASSVVIQRTRPVTRRMTQVTVKPSAPVEEQAEVALVQPTSEANFPEFLYATYPAPKTPNWGAMRSALEWDRSFGEMNPSDFVPVPKYDLKHLTTPMYNLKRDLQEVNIGVVTEKLFYSTRYMGRYHADSNEFEGVHPGIDLKLAPETPVGSVAGGRVHATGIDQYLGSFVMVEHILPDTGEHVVSIYGHLSSISVQEGKPLKPGSLIGYVGSTGRSSGPHLHLQIDYKKNTGRHEAYIPAEGAGPSEVSQWMIHPIEFIARYPKD